MHSLPTEVLQGILRAVKVSSLASPDFSFLTCLCVCSWWHEIGIQLLYTDVALNNSRLPRFIEGHQPARLAMTRSLTIQIKPGGAPEASTAVPNHHLATVGSTQTRALWASLPRLAFKITHMVNLESFSFSVAGVYVRVKDEGFWLRDSDVENIITSLPSTLRHVEIDTKGYNRSTFPAAHLCPKLRTRVPYLQTLRLRLASLCPSILELAAWEPDRAVSPSDQSSGLKSLVINLIGPYGSSTTILCEDTERLFACTTSADAWRLQHDSCNRLRASLVSQSEKALSSQDFPPIARLSIIDTDNSSEPTDYSFTAVNDRDLVKRETTSNPFYMFRYETALHYQDTHGKDAVVIGDYFAEVEAFAEGHPWVETIDGLRFPASFKTTPRCKEGIFLWKVPQVQDRETYYANGNGILYWWDYENVAGHRLLRARVTDGVGDVEAVQRERSQKEMEDEADAEEAEALFNPEREGEDEDRDLSDYD